jgi:prenyltransferase beta subunit
VDVTHRTTCTDRVYSFLRRLKSSLSALEQRVFAASDANARRYGWQITRVQGGLSRNYRDAGFGYLSTCAAGSGGGFSSCGAQRSEHSLKEPAP